MDITWIRGHLIGIGAIHVDDTRYVVSNRITDVLHEIDMEYMIGLHCSVSHTPSESTQRRDGAWTYFLHYGFCEPIDETVHLLCHTTLESRVKALIMHNLEEKLIIKRLKG